MTTTATTIASAAVGLPSGAAFPKPRPPERTTLYILYLPPVVTLPPPPAIAAIAPNGTGAANVTMADWVSLVRSLARSAGVLAGERRVSESDDLMFREREGVFLPRSSFIPW